MSILMSRNLRSLACSGDSLRPSEAALKSSMSSSRESRCSTCIPSFLSVSSIDGGNFAGSSGPRSTTRDDVASKSAVANSAVCTEWRIDVILSRGSSVTISAIPPWTIADSRWRSGRSSSSTRVPSATHMSDFLPMNSREPGGNALRNALNCVGRVLSPIRTPNIDDRASM